MIRNVSLSASRLLIALVLFLVTAQLASAQRGKVPDYYESFLNTQFWLGLRIGLNYTDPIIKNTYTSFNSLDDVNETYEKTYSVFENPGGQAGLQMALYHKGFSMELSPTFKIVRYAYSSDINWRGNAVSGVDDFSSRYDINQSINLIEVPLMLKYDVLKSGKIRPFIMGGLQYSFLIDARKNTEITHTDYSGGSARSYNGGSISLGVKEQFKNFYGVIGGAGASFDYSNIRTIIELSYLYALSPVTDTNNLYNENELTSLGEVNDELQLNNINIAISFVFPFRYIDSSFQSN